MARQGEKISDHDRIEEMQALLSAVVPALERLMQATEILSEEATASTQERVRPLLEAVRTAYLLGRDRADGIADRAAPAPVQ
ncbi:hypothetical protein [Streptomyces sp. SID8352]|uniref:hypothetical protein n=1 Tax=Streptomyces sp. SID8352 TaxID=2690338 RepID=UPI001368718B|nr:hypothetical protein [Streptomyces sp. SID8352]MYU23725.1 hypothetical protein [Streptomyces sp. SID8352]